jgi:hypothetical protein
MARTPLSSAKRNVSSESAGVKGGDVESSNKQNAQTQAILCLECSDIQSCHDRLRALVEVKVTPIHDWSGRKAFRCVDIDGNILEIFESISTKQQISDQKL